VSSLACCGHAEVGQSKHHNDSSSCNAQRRSPPLQGPREAGLRRRSQLGEQSGYD
jgi:hypothetical protein